MNAPMLRARLTNLRDRRDKIEAEINEILSLLDERKIATPSGRRSRLELPKCGSETAYQRHVYRRRKYGEAMPEDCGCREAHAEHNRRKGAA